MKRNGEPKPFPSRVVVWLIAALTALSAGLVRAAATVTVAPPAQPSSVTFMDTTRDNENAQLAIDSSGGQHVIYDEYNVVEYAQCLVPASCDAAAGWTQLALPLDLTGFSIPKPPEIQVTPAGTPRVLITLIDNNFSSPTFGTGFFRYASCDSACDSPGGWAILDLSTIFSAPNSDFIADRLSAHFFALDPNGNPRFAFASNPTYPQLDGVTYAYCDAACAASTAGWSAVHLTNSSTANPVFLYYLQPAIAITSSGSPRLIAYVKEQLDLFGQQVLWYRGYLECNASCGTATNWSLTSLQSFSMSSPTTFGSHVLRTDASGGVDFAVYNDNGSGTLAYYSCTAGCSVAGNWVGSSVGLASGDGLYPDLRFGNDNNPQLVFQTGGGAGQLGTGLSWAGCTAQCNTAAASWTAQRVDDGASSGYAAGNQFPDGSTCTNGLPLRNVWVTGYYPSMALDGAGAMHVSMEADHYYCQFGPEPRIVVNRFASTAPAGPAVTSASPNTGNPLGGDSVTVTGSGFSGATAVSFGANAASTYTVVSDSQITATSPPGSGTVDITVTAPAGTSATSPADQFTYM